MKRSIGSVAVAVSALLVACSVAYPPSASVMSGETSVSRLEAEERAEVNERCSERAPIYGAINIVWGIAAGALGVAMLGADNTAFGAINLISGATGIGLGIWQFTVGGACSDAAEEWLFVRDHLATQ